MAIAAADPSAWAHADVPFCVISAGSYPVVLRADYGPSPTGTLEACPGWIRQGGRGYLPRQPRGCVGDQPKPALPRRVQVPSKPLWSWSWVVGFGCRGLVGADGTVGGGDGEG